MAKNMQAGQSRQEGGDQTDQNRWRAKPWNGGAGARRERIVPNPKLKLLDQVREIMRLRHYSIRTERCYCDWIRRYVQFHRMKSRSDLDGGEGKIELFLGDLAVRGQVAASTQNQAVGRVERWELRVESHGASTDRLKPLSIRRCFSAAAESF